MSNFYEDQIFLKQTIEGSSAISAFEYNKITNMLTVVFTHGGRYDYPDIPEKIVRDWMLANSKGKYYNQVIRKRII